MCQPISGRDKASKTKLTTLISRVNSAADAHAAELGTALTATLKAFDTAWQNSRTQQEQKKGTVEETF